MPYIHVLSFVYTTNCTIKMYFWLIYWWMCDFESMYQYALACMRERERESREGQRFWKGISLILDDSNLFLLVYYRQPLLNDKTIVTFCLPDWKRKMDNTSSRDEVLRELVCYRCCLHTYHIVTLFFLYHNLLLKYFIPKIQNRLFCTHFNS